MGKTWSNNKRSIRDFESWLDKGKTVYVINDHAMIPGQFEPHTYSAHKCTGRHPILGHWMFGGSVDAKGLVCTYRQVFENPPPGLRDLAGSEPDCRDEGLYGIGRGQEFKGDFGTRGAAIEEMELLSAEARDRARDDKKVGRRSWR